MHLHVSRNHVLPTGRIGAQLAPVRLLAWCARVEARKMEARRGEALVDAEMYANGLESSSSFSGVRASGELHYSDELDRLEAI